jgi:hypothetical protein
VTCCIEVVTMNILSVFPGSGEKRTVFCHSVLG